MPSQPATATVADEVVDQDTVDREFNQLLKDTYGPGPDADYFWELEGATGPPHDPPIPPPHEPPPPTSTPPASARVGDATVPGIGVIPATVIQALTRQFGTTISRTLIDATTGITLETSEQQHRPSRKLEHFIKTRDQHCRFPGCTHPATRCDIDHVTPLAPRPDNRSQPANPVPTPPPHQTIPRLDHHHDTPRHLHLDQPHQPHLHHHPAE